LYPLFYSYNRSLPLLYAGGCRIFLDLYEDAKGAPTVNKSWKRLLLGCGIFVLLAAAAAGGYMWHLYHQVEAAAVQMYEPLPDTWSPFTSSDNEVALLGRQPSIGQDGRAYTVLIIGSDSRSGERGRADTLVVVSVRPDARDALLLSIPRDTRTEIAGLGIEDKINHAYAYGGAPMTVRTVEQWLDYPIDYYISIDMKGFKEIIDHLGGVKVDNPAAFQHEGYKFKQGVIQLNGSEALEYSRMRKEDPRGDLGRNERQRQVLSALADKTLRPSAALQLDKLLRASATMVKTNMTFEDMKRCASQFRGRPPRLQSMEVEGSGMLIRGIWYYIVEEDERQRLHEQLKLHAETDDAKSGSDSGKGQLGAAEK
jgi:polyisoprenyl-teichoic acid--peptidoglycan teichoic acid transferase